MAGQPVVALTRKSKARKKSKNTKAAMGPKSRSTKVIPTKALTQAVNQIVKRNEETKFVIDAPWKSSATLPHLRTSHVPLQALVKYIV